MELELPAVFISWVWDIIVSLPVWNFKVCVFLKKGVVSLMLLLLFGSVCLFLSIETKGSSLNLSFPSISLMLVELRSCLTSFCLDMDDLMRDRFWNIFMFSVSMVLSFIMRWLFFLLTIKLRVDRVPFISLEM